MDAIVGFLGSDSLAAVLVVVVGGAVGLARLAFADMYASRWWRLQPHWD